MFENDGPKSDCPFGLCGIAFDPCYDVRTYCRNHLYTLGIELKKQLSNKDEPVGYASISTSRGVVIVPKCCTTDRAKIVLTVHNGKRNHIAYHNDRNLWVTVCVLGVSGKATWSKTRNSDVDVIQIVKRLLAEP